MIDVFAKLEGQFVLSSDEFRAFCEQMGEPVPEDREAFLQNETLFAAFRGYMLYRLRWGFLELSITDYSPGK